MTTHLTLFIIVRPLELGLQVCANKVTSEARVEVIREVNKLPQSEWFQLVT